MSIINFDKVMGKKFQDAKLYENSKFIPPNPFFAVILGMSGCGKTSLLLNIILRYMKFDKIVLCAKQNQENKYMFLEDVMTEVAKKIGVSLDQVFESHSSPSTLPDVEQQENDGKTKILIIDDMIAERNQDKFINYFIAGRKKNFSVFYLAHRYTQIPKLIRNNTNIFFLYSQKPREVGIIYQDLVNDLTLSEFRKLYSKATTRYNFLTIDMVHSPKYRLNLEPINRL